MMSEHRYILRLHIVCNHLPWALFQRNETLKIKNYLFCSSAEKSSPRSGIETYFPRKKILFLQFSTILALYFRWRQI